MGEGGTPLPLYRDSPAYRPKVDPLSEEALVHLKSYKYSSVDKSLISHYILRHYVLIRCLPSYTHAESL